MGAVTAREIATLLRGKRAGPGKWMCKCPVHRDRTASLSVREGKKCVLIHCFRGCETQDILDTIGLKMSALYPDGKRDREAERLAERMRREAESKRKRDRRRERDRIDLQWKWDKVRNALGLLLIQRPSSDKLAQLFHHACTMSREVPSTGKSPQRLSLKPGEVFPSRPILDGITARDVGSQIAKILRLP
jgi:hypothetical protein